MENRKIPSGLSALATLNFIATILIILRASSIVSQLSETAKTATKVSVLVYAIIALLYFFSGIGYLKIMWYQGYFLGNMTAVGVLLSIMFSIIINDVKAFNMVPEVALKTVYPILTLLLLNIKYRGLFERNKRRKSKSHFVNSIGDDNFFV